MRQLRIAGRVFGTAITIFTTNWGPIASAAVAAGTGAWAWWGYAARWGYLSVGVAVLLTFAALMWTINGIAWFAGRNRSISVHPDLDFSYGLAYEGILVAYNVTNDLSTLQIGVNLRNVSPSVLVYKVERFDVVIGNRTIAKPLFLTQGGLIPRGVGRTYRYPSFSKSDIADFIGQNPSGTIALAINYGYPNKRPTRQLKMKIDIALRLDGRHGGSDAIVCEDDEPL